MSRLAFAALVCVGGCALVQPPARVEPAPRNPAEMLSAVTIGKSTKADVRAALGEAVVIDFNSGYEVWVYREKPREKATPLETELVLLFAPSGILTRTRIR